MASLRFGRVLPTKILHRHCTGKGARFRERLSLVGNPNVKEDWYVNPKTGEQIDFVYFART